MIQDPNSGHTIQMGSDMLPIPRGLRKVLLFEKKTSVENLHALAMGIGSRMDVGDEIKTRSNQPYHRVNQRSRHQGAISTDPDDPLGFIGIHDLSKTRPDIFEVAPVNSPSSALGKFSHGIILPGVTGGQDNILPSASLANGLEDMRQNFFASKLCQHLAREPSGSIPGLNHSQEACRGGIGEGQARLGSNDGAVEPVGPGFGCRRAEPYGR